MSGIKVGQIWVELYHSDLHEADEATYILRIKSPTEYEIVRSRSTHFPVGSVHDLVQGGSWLLDSKFWKLDETSKVEQTLSKYED
jgi:hypothetical protein